VQAEAPGTRWAQSQLVVPGPAASRAAALESVRAHGVEIRGLTSEDGRLDVLYRDLAGGAP
jgi:Cu-processing system ATP-binding protein